MTSPTARLPITAEEAAALDPTQIAPPILVIDGEHITIGAAHGRVLPLIGNRRPYVYDVSLPDRRRVYADTPEDAIAVIIGGEYAELLANLRALESTLDAEATSEVWLSLASLRHRHADQLRLSMQQQINELAQREGQWDHLDESAREQLSKAADPDGPYPVGIATETPILDDDGEMKVATLGYWYAPVPLVLNAGDYEPYSNAERPISEMSREEDGRNVVIPGDPNLIVLDITDSVTYLGSLERAGHLTVTVMPAEQPDRHFRGLPTV